MNDLVILVSGLAVVFAATRIEPVRGWWKALLAERYLLAFVLPLFMLLGWPIEHIEAYRQGQELGWQRVARIAVFGAFAFHFMLTSLLRRRLSIPRLPAFAVFAVYATWCALSALWSLEPLQTLWKAIELFVILMFAVYLYQDRRQPKARAAQLASAMMFLAFALCVTSIVGGILAPDRAWYEWEVAGMGVRSMNGVVPQINANTLGQLGGTVALVSLARISLSSPRRRWGDWLALCVGVATLLLAYSRTSLISSALCFILLGFALRRPGAIIFVTPLLAMVTMLFVEPLMTYLMRGQEVEQFLSMSGRTFMWDAALVAFGERPFLGHGFFVGHKYVELDGGNQLATVDSTYIETLVNLGIVGLVLIVLFAVLALHTTWRVSRKLALEDSRASETAAISLTFVTFLVVRSLTASSFQVLHYNLLFLMVALVALRLAASPVRHSRMSADRIT